MICAERATKLNKIDLASIHVIAHPMVEITACPLVSASRKSLGHHKSPMSPTFGEYNFHFQEIIV